MDSTTNGIISAKYPQLRQGPLWQPGHSGNPSGRHKLEGMIQDALERDERKELRKIIWD